MKKFIPQNVYTHLPQTASRLEWADVQGRYLSRSIKNWEMRSGLGVDVSISEDRLNCHWVLKLSKDPPLKIWGLRFGDAIHNVRSSLDNAVYEKAIAMGVNTKLSKIEFPICESDSDWTSKRSKLNHLPTELLKTIESLQPYNQHDILVRDNLLLLSSFNNNDKHRVPIISAGIITQPKFTAEATPFGGEPDHEWHWTFNASAQPLPLSDGTKLLELVSVEKLGKVKGNFSFITQLIATNSEGKCCNLTGSLASMLESVLKVTDSIASVDQVRVL